MSIKIKCQCCGDKLSQENLGCKEEYCDYCTENGNHCSDCGELFVDDCIGDLCFDCRLECDE